MVSKVFLVFEKKRGNSGGENYEKQAPVVLQDKEADPA